MMSDSLRDQLIKAGLATEKQARRADRELHRDRKAQGPKRPEPTDQQRAADQARAAKAARDQALNRERQAQAEAKARAAEIRQLIEQHRIAKPESHEYFNFIDRRKVRRIPINAELRERLARGDVAIARYEARYDFVPSDIAARIRERDARMVMSLDSSTDDAPDENDPYKDFVVPDDLKW
jgi:uncharacterized protein YaiL (DUF2058 family)